MQPSPSLQTGPALAAPPWRLQADAYLFALALPRAGEHSALFIADELREARIGRVGFMMYVDYGESPVGPYKELLFIPGRFRFGSRWLWSITKIYVSTQASVDNGRHHWGIPKERATFEVEREDEQVEQLRVLREDAVVAELRLRHGSIGVPVSTTLVPPRLRMLGQALNGREFVVTPRARGTVQRAKVEHARSEPSLFVPLETRSILAAVKLTDAELTFPVATIR